MQILVKDPYSRQSITLNVTSEDYNGKPSWRIRFPHKFSFLLIRTNGRWQTAEDIDLHPALINDIVLALSLSVRTDVGRSVREVA